jgi:poly(A) polymerase
MTSSDGLEVGSETARPHPPLTLPRDQHAIDASLVDDAALSVVRGLRDGGFAAYLVGGCVRDMLLGLAPKDFDVATDATPEDVQRVFRRARLVGRRFRIAHVRFGREIIEVSTFRRQVDDDDVVEDHSRRELRDRDSARSSEGMILRDNVWGTIDDDAFRRDFSVNALYYDPIDEVLIDYVGGLADLRARRLRLIGDARIRLREDPVRILRAIRFASKLDFAIDPEIDAAIPGAAYLISAVAPARLFDEICKLFLDGHAVGAWRLMHRYALADVLFPDHDTSAHSVEFIDNAMRGTDERVRQDKPVTAGFLIAVLLWDAYRERLARLAETMPLVDAREAASQEVLRDQNDIAAVPRRFAQFIRETWLLQPRLETRHGKDIERLLSHPRFRAAYDFLVLRATVGDIDEETANWWTAYQAAAPEERQALRSALGPQGGKRRRRRRRRGGASAPAQP